MSESIPAESDFSPKEFSARRKADALLRMERFRNRTVLCTLLALLLVFALIFMGEFFIAFVGAVVVIISGLWMWTVRNHVKEIQRRPYGDPRRSIPESPATGETANRSVQSGDLKRE